KEHLKKLYKLTVEEYDRHIPKGMAKDQKASEEASRAAVEFYSRNVNGETMAHSAEKVKAQEAAKRPENPGSSMNYINISADPHLMQRVLYEILRRSCDSDRSNKKRKHDLLHRTDGKFAEEMFDRETRGSRPGLMDYTIKRKRTEEWEATAGARKKYTLVY